MKSNAIFLDTFEKMIDIIKISIKNFIGNLPIFISMLFLVVLFSNPEVISVTVCLSVALSILISCLLMLKEKILFSLKKMPLFSKVYSAILSIVITLCFGHIFFYAYYNDNFKCFGFKTTVIIAIFLSIGAWLCAYVLIALLFDYLISKQIEADKKYDTSKLFHNFLTNIYLWFSGFCFVLINMNTEELYKNAIWPSITIATGFIGMFMSLKPSLLKDIKKFKPFVRILALICALGGLDFSTRFFKRLFESYCINSIDLPKWLNVNDMSKIVCFIIYFIALAFLWLLISYFYDYISDYIKASVKGTFLAEYIVIIVIGIFYMVVMTYCFINSTAFYNSSIRYDLIYTSDSGEIANSNVFAFLNARQNDIRQPLFSLFSIPFFGLFDAASYIFSFSYYSYVLFLGYSQIVLMFFTMLILVNTFNMNKLYKTLSLVLLCVIYPTMIFSLMIEQYIVAVFWLVLYMHFLVKKNEDNEFLYIGTVGTLVTSFVMRFFVMDRFSFKDFKEKFLKCVKSAITVLVGIFTFSRLQVLTVIVHNIDELYGFTGSDVSFISKLMQYFTFVSSCFIAPPSRVYTSLRFYKHYVWRMDEVKSLNILGIIIFALIILSFILNRKDKFSRMSFLWICFSLFLFLILGWGTMENGLLLYTLYFAWAFVYLLVKLLEYISEKIKFKHLFTIVLSIVIVTIIVLNCGTIAEFIRFALNWEGPFYNTTIVQ